MEDESSNAGSDVLDVVGWRAVQDVGGGGGGIDKKYGGRTGRKETYLLAHRSDWKS